MRSIVATIVVVLALAVAVVAVTADENAGMEMTPFGLVPSNCVVRVPSGSHVFYSEDESVAFVRDANTRDVSTLPNCQAFQKEMLKRRSEEGAMRRADGWQVYAQYVNTALSFNSFTGFFTVPQKPAQWSGTVLYLFTALQGTSTAGLVDIIQPVLQYGASNAGNANGWGVASWYVTSTGSFIVSHPLVAVSPGDSINGTMKQTGADTWLVSGTSVKLGQSSNMTVTRSILKTQNQAYCTLESYGLTTCSNYPANPCVFSNLVLKAASGAVSPTWTPTVGSVTCATSKVVVNSPSSVSIQFQ